MAAEPKVSDDGRLWTPGAVDFFRVVNAQVGALTLQYKHLKRTLASIWLVTVLIAPQASWTRQ